MPRSDGEILLGQLYDREQDVVVKFTEQMMEHLHSESIWGQARTEISPNDMKSSKVRVYQLPDITTVFSSAPSTMNINLPDVLLGVTITSNKNWGDGEDIKQVGMVFATGTSGSASMTPSARAQASGAIQLDAQPNIKQTWGQNVPVMIYSFLMPGNFTASDILARMSDVVLLVNFTSVLNGSVTLAAGKNHGLTPNQPFQFKTLTSPTGGIAINTTYYVKTVFSAVAFNYSTTAPSGIAGPVASGHSAIGVGTLTPNLSQWPKFKPEAVTVTLHGAQTSLGQNAESVLQYSWAGTTNAASVIAPYGDPPSRSDGYSTDCSVSVRSIRIPPTLHGVITLAAAGGLIDSQLITVNVDASTPGLDGSGGAPDFLPVENNPPARFALIEARVIPVSIPATVPPSIPTSGLYIVDVQVRPYAYGYQRVTVVVVDFSQFA